MGFKKNNINSSFKFIPNLVWIISLWIIFFLWYQIINNSLLINIKIDENNDLSISNNENTDINIEKNIPSKTNNSIKTIIKDNYLKKENNKNKINILIVWRWWGNHDAPNLTDTIILASIDTKFKTITMLSIPRDFYVEYPKSKYNSKKISNWKINWLYAKYRFDNNSQKIWMDVLKDKVSQITWENIDFFVNVDFKWFTKIIDTIWWIKITIPTHFVDNKYPDWNWWYKTLVFKKWTWIFDWENSLKYARSRHSTSDFDRSMRQQQVIKSIKDKLTWSYFFTSPWKIKELYDVFVNHVYTDLKLTTIIKLAYNFNWPWEFKVLSSNLNDSCFYWSDTCQKWWFLYTPSREYFWWMSVLLAEGTNIESLNNYNSLQRYTKLVFNYPDFFKEKYKINIFNSLKINHLAWKISNNIVRYWFYIPQRNSIWNTKEIYKNSIIYYNNINKNSTTLKVLKIFFKWELKETKFPIYSKDNANIEIIIWEDYLWNNNPFNF